MSNADPIVRCSTELVPLIVADHRSIHHLWPRCGGLIGLTETNEVGKIGFDSLNTGTTVSFPEEDSISVTRYVRGVIWSGCFSQTFPSLWGKITPIERT